MRPCLTATRSEGKPKGGIEHRVVVCQSSHRALGLTKRRLRGSGGGVTTESNPRTTPDCRQAAPDACPTSGIQGGNGPRGSDPSSGDALTARFSRLTGSDMPMRADVLHSANPLPGCLKGKLATQANLAVPPLDETALRKLAERGSHRHP